MPNKMDYYHSKVKCHSNIKLIGYVWILILITSCQTESKYHKVSGETMGTYYAITYQGDNPEQVKNEVDQILVQFNQSVSTYIPESTISRLNKSKEGITYLMSDDIYLLPVFKKALELGKMTDGSLEVAVMPLVNYWGFGYTGRNKITAVDSAKVGALLTTIREEKIEPILRGNSIQLKKSDPNLEIDFSSLAKGYGIDILANYFNEKGISNYLIDIGGESRAKGKNNIGKAWTIAINKPKENSPPNTMEVIVQLDNQAMATSGNYRIFYESNGKKFAHIINPKTGFPALSNLLSASIIADDCMTADGLATAMMVMGLEEAKTFLANHPFPACLIFDEDGDNELEKFYANEFPVLNRG